MFSRQLATMLEAGVTLLKSLDVLTKQIESRRLLEAAEDVKHSIANGNSFHDALIKHPKIFTDFWVHIVETGEASGALPVTLAQLADYLETTAAMRRKVTSALIYPAVLIGLSMVALTVFTVWIIPIFARVFESFNLELPAITVLVMNFSNFVRKFLLVLLAMFGVLVFLLFKYLQTENGKWQFDRIILKVPIVSSLFQRIAIERFASGLGTLIESGVPILYALDIVGKAVGNKVMEEGIGEVRESVRQGKGMGQPLGKNPIFTPMVVQMVAVGEEIGELGKMLRKISEFYKERIATALERITTLIEPIVLVFMGGVVGVMVVSMFMPIFQLAMLAKG
jgi:type IV pilus assembly protein PilC